MLSRMSMIHGIQRQAPVTGDSAVCRSERVYQEKCPARKGREVLSLQQFPLSPKTLGKASCIIINWGKAGWKQMHGRAGKIENSDPWPGFFQVIPTENHRFLIPHAVKEPFWSLDPTPHFPAMKVSRNNAKPSTAAPTNMEHICLHGGSAPASWALLVSRGVHEGYKPLSFYYRKHSTQTTFTPGITWPFLMSNVVKPSLWHHS